MKQACTGEGLAGQSQACGRTFPCLPNVSPSHRFQHFQKKFEKRAPLSGSSRRLKKKRLAYNGLHHFGDEWLGDKEGRFRPFASQQRFRVGGDEYDRNGRIFMHCIDGIET